MKLYSYWRSSTSYRVRIALNLKGLSYDMVPVNLVREGGEHLKPEYVALNPQAIVPTLMVDGTLLGQSLAICEYLDEVYPEPPLLPPDPLGRARVRAFAQAVACEIHPLTNLRVLRHLQGVMGCTEEEKLAWYRHWTGVGLQALESMVAGQPGTGTFVHGDMPTLADICLVPQMYNARRYAIDLTPYPTLRRLDERARKEPAFAKAAPENQADAQQAE